MKEIRATVPIQVLNADTNGKELPEDEALFIVSNEGTDRHGQNIRLAGIDRTDFRNNPAVLWVHNMFQDLPPIGMVIKDFVKDGNLYEHVKFDMEDDFAAKVCSKVKRGFIKACSIGGRVLEFGKDQDGMENYADIQKMTQTELSIVPVGAHPDALVVAKSLGFESQEELDLVKQYYARGKISEPLLFDIAKLNQQYETATSLTKALGDAIEEVKNLASTPNSASENQVRQTITLAKDIANSTRGQNQNIVITLADALKGK